MLNQVILIGRVLDTQINDTGAVTRITLNVSTGTNTDIIAIDTDQKKALYGPFSKDSIIADRITVLGGINSGT